MMARTSLMVVALSAALLSVSAAHAQRFIDNGDGTLTDRQSGLMWEKKTSSGGVHDVSGRYTWCSMGADELHCANRTNLADGTVFTVFLATLNNGAFDRQSGTITGCFANHCDWRIPSLAELKTIFDPNRSDICPNGISVPPGGPPCIDPAFGSTQASSLYWSATSVSGSGSNWAEGVSFGNNGSGDPKPSAVYVRAVRYDVKPPARYRHFSKAGRSQAVDRLTRSA